VKQPRGDPMVARNNTPLQAQPCFSFMALVAKTAELPKTAERQLPDPLTLGQTKVV